MFLSEFLAGVQLLILLAMVPVVAMAQRTSRRRRSKQKTFFSLAILLTSVSLMCLLWILLSTSAAVSSDDLSYWIALLIPGAVVPLCLWTTWRAMDKRPTRSRSSPSGYDGRGRF